MKYLRGTVPFAARAGAFRLFALCMALLSGAALVAPAVAQDATDWSGSGVTVLPGGAQLPAAASSQAKIAAGIRHTCALTSAGGVKCWGWNREGQLGDGTTTDRLTPVAVSGLESGVAAVAAGLYHSCALTSAGAVKCWGGNYSGQLGDGSRRTSRLTPVAVSGLASGVVAIAAGSDHSCAVTSAGAAKCWGDNYWGALGDGNATYPSLTPVTVSGLTNAASIAAGVDHSCAATRAGAARCWGWNRDGQLGNGTTRTSLRRVAVSGLASGVAAIAAGAIHSCALTGAGAVKCWGDNAYGQIGDGTTTDRLIPIDVNGLARSSAIAAGWNHSCALTSTGAVKCWGSNEYGQLGDGTTTGRLTPVAVHRLLSSGVVAIAAGVYHSCAATSAGAVKCWGRNDYGQLGDGTTTNRLRPVDVIGF